MHGVEDKDRLELLWLDKAMSLNLEDAIATVEKHSQHYI